MCIKDDPQTGILSMSTGDGDGDWCPRHIDQHNGDCHLGMSTEDDDGEKHVYQG